MKRLLIYLALVLLIMPLKAQKRDSKSVAMVGATTTIAEGIYAVGYNPALLAFQKDKPFMLQLGGLDFGMGNNYISMAGMSTLSGDTLDNDEKTFIINRLQNSGGLAFNVNGQIALPGINFTSGNMAVTSNIMYFSSYTLPAGMARLMLEGNASNPVIDMTLNYEIMAVSETAFSFAIPFESFALGLSLKYLQGLLYMGIDPDSSQANFVTTPTSVYGSGRYYLRSGVGGSGYALDIGLATKDLNGMRFGVSLINALGMIKWNEPSSFKDILAGKDNKFGNSDDLWHLKWGGTPLTDSVSVVYTYSIDSLRADNLSSGSIFNSSSEVVYNLDEDNKPKPFNVRYPAIFRIGGSYRKDDLLISSDLTTGFEDRLYTNSRWRWAIAAELYRFPLIPMRMGFAWEGLDRTELGMGVGFYGGPVMIDIGFAFKHGMWIHSMKGLNLSVGFTMTGFQGRQDKAKSAPSGPSPIPEDLLPSEDQKQDTTNGK